MASMLEPGAGRRTPRWMTLSGMLACVLLGLAGVSNAASAAPAGPIVSFGPGVVGYGAPTGASLSAPVAGMAPTPDDHGYWLVGADGGVLTFGDAPYYGSQAGQGVVTPFVGIAPTMDGHGYWIAGDFADVFHFGDAPDEGVINGSLRAPVVGIASDSQAMGYWLVSADGGVFTFGRAEFHGSMGKLHLNAPAVGMAATPDAHGYWVVAADGGVFSFGDAAFHGSMANIHLNAPIVGIASTTDGRGYRLVAADGGVFSFGDAAFHGSMGSGPPSPRVPVVAIAAARHSDGYWLATTAKQLPPPTTVPSVLADCNQANPTAAVRPSTIMLACGDGNAFLAHLSWLSWTATGATGAGLYTHNTCTPSCAAGTFVSVTARVQLSYPIETRAGKEFASISYTFANPSPPHQDINFTVVAATSAG
jgi:hypothetical protein